jgi:predicted transcriptional regulator
MGISSNLSLDDTVRRLELLQASARVRSMNNRETQATGMALPSEVLALAVEIVTNHFLKRLFLDADLPYLSEKLNFALISLEVSKTLTKPQLVPAVPVEESVTDDYIVCLEDGKRMKMLKGHLRVSFNLTPEQYRKRWGLPEDYPMVAPAYARRRSLIAKKNGLGGKSNIRRKTVDQMDSS